MRHTSLFYSEKNSYMVIGNIGQQSPAAEYIYV